MSSGSVDLGATFGSGVVSSLNGLSGALTLVAGTGITITPSGSNITISASAAAFTIGALDAQAANAQGLAYVAGVLSTQSADATHPGMVNNVQQTFGGNKTFTSVGINDTSAAAGLFVKTPAIGTPTQVIKAIAGQTANLFEIRDVSNVVQMQFTAGGNFQFYNTATISEARFDVRPSVSISGINTGANARYGMFIGDPLTPQAAGQGSGIAFGGAYDNIGTNTEFGYIWTTKDNSTNGNLDASMHFATRNNSTGLAQRVLDMSAAGNSTFFGTIAATNFSGTSSGTNTGNVTIGTANGLSLIGQVLSLQLASATQPGALSAADWATFNNKLSPSASNYITNPDAEVNTVGWNLYNNQGNTASAYVIAQDITFTAVAAGAAGNGINIDYIFHPTQSYLTPLVTVLSSTHVTVAWYNGPTVANNPTATQLKAAWDAVPGAVALATAAITGTASHLQYETGANITANGGDTTPTTGTGGAVVGVTFTRNTSTPLVGIASFDLGKDGVNRQGEGVSTDFTINSLDKGNQLQISFAYQGSAGMVLGTGSDVQIFIYDITNATLIPVTPLRTIKGPVSTPHIFVGKFQSVSTSVSYRLIFHIATTSTTAWDLLLDSVVVNSIITPGAATQVPSLVLPAQPISGAVTDHMCVMWRDGATQWVPATIAGAAIPAFGTDKTQLGFATNIVGSVADIYIRGSMDGFSFGPFTGYEQYIDNVAGGISPLPSPFNDTYVMVGMAISSTVLNIQFDTHVDLIANGSGTPLKGGLLSNSAVNDGTGDQVLAVGGNGTVLVANSAATLGINWAPAVVAAAPFTYTTATRTLTIATATNAIAGVLSAADHTTYSGYAATIALKAPLASPVFTGDVNVSTGNLLVSTIGKGIQVKTGANAKIGTAVLVAGTVTVANTSVTANSRIFVTSNTDGGTPGWLRVSAKTVGTSFVITSSSVLDTSTVAWYIVESIP